MDKQQDDYEDQNTLINQAGMSEIPTEVRRSIEDSLEFSPKPARKYLFFQSFQRGIESSPFKSIRAFKVMAIITTINWILSLLFLGGACVNYLLLEDIELFTTSHDARIESIPKPVKISGVN